MMADQQIHDVYKPERREFHPSPTSGGRAKLITLGDFWKKKWAILSGNEGQKRLSPENSPIITN